MRETGRKGRERQHWTHLNLKSFSKRRSGDLWALLVLNSMVKIVSLRNFKRIAWYKLIVCFVLPCRVLFRLWVHSSFDSRQNLAKNFCIFGMCLPQINSSRQAKERKTSKNICGLRRKNVFFHWEWAEEIAEECYVHHRMRLLFLDA